jgi:hypothetical protein
MMTIFKLNENNCQAVIDLFAVVVRRVGELNKPVGKTYIKDLKSFILSTLSAAERNIGVSLESQRSALLRII